MVNIRPQHDGTQWPHQETCTEGHQRQHQRGKGIVTREKGFGDSRGVITKHHEIEHFQEITAGHIEDGSGITLRLAGGIWGRSHGSHTASFWVFFRFILPAADLM